jgi:hypothetical protein
VYVLAAALLGCGSPQTELPVDQGPPPDQAPPFARPRLTVQDVFQGDGTARIRIGSFVYDTQLESVVGPAIAADGQARWLPIGDWVPWAQAVAQPAASYSETSSIWLDSACTKPFAITPAKQPRARFLWESQPQGINVWRIGATDVTDQPMWISSGASCTQLGAAQRQLLLKDRKAWLLGELLSPADLVSAQFSSHERASYGVELAATGAPARVDLVGGPSAWISAHAAAQHRAAVEAPAPGRASRDVFMYEPGRWAGHLPSGVSVSRRGGGSDHHFRPINNRALIQALAMPFIEMKAGDGLTYTGAGTVVPASAPACETCVQSDRAACGDRPSLCMRRPTGEYCCNRR